MEAEARAAGRSSQVAFEAWQHDLNGICGHYFGRRRHRGGVAGRVRACRFNDMDVADISGDVDAITRDRQGIRRDEEEHVFGLFQIAGNLRVRHNGHRSRLSPGTGLLLDSTKEGALIFPEEGCRFISLHMPRQTFLDAGTGRVRIGRPMSQDHPMAEAIWRQVRLFVLEQQGAPLPEDGITKASDALLLSMIQLAFAVPQGESAPTELTCNAERHAYAIQLIEANLSRPDLSLDWLAAEMRLSARHLQRIFQEQGERFAKAVRDRRLRLAAERLARGGAGTRIGEVAFSAGFRDLSNFNRAFKVRYGMPPRAYAEARQGQA
jgi:AraC-like DNA-binding protein